MSFPYRRWYAELSAGELGDFLDVALTGAPDYVKEQLHQKYAAGHHQIHQVSQSWDHWEDHRGFDWTNISSDSNVNFDMALTCFDMALTSIFTRVLGVAFTYRLNTLYIDLP